MSARRAIASELLVLLLPSVVSCRTEQPAQPPLRDTLRTMGEESLSMNQAVAARDALTKALAADPGALRLWILLGAAQRDSGNMKDAYTCFMAVWMVDAYRPDLRAELGRLYEAMDDNEQALQTYRTALTIFPDDARLKRQAANLLARLGYDEEAGRLLRDLRAKEPNSE